MRVRRDKKRIVILCEGDTEINAIRYFIAPHWQKDGFKEIGLHTINLNGKLGDIAKLTPRYAQENKVVAVFTLVDLYGTNQVQHSRDDELAQKIVNVQNWLQKGLLAKIRKKFHPHVSVHEIEAWLLAEGNCLAKRLNDKTIQPDPQAETRNFENPPSRRLQALFKSRSKNYLKIQDGTALFQDADFETVYTSCPYFKAFYDDLKVVAEANL
jgi:hypothetical protein